MSCNTKTSLAAVIDAVNAQLNNNYVDRDDPRIDQGVFTEPTIRGGLMLDEAAKLDFCGYVTECGQREPFGKQWVDRPLYPHNTLVSYEDGGEIKSRWQDIDDVVAGTEIGESYIAYEETRSLGLQGYTIIDSFELGATITQRDQALRHAATGELYRWAGDLPKTVPAGSTPADSGGVGTNAWLDVSDTALRQEILTGGLLTINKGLESIADLSTINNPKDGFRVYVKSYHAGLSKGGGYFIYDSSRAAENDGGTVVNGWVRELPLKNIVSSDYFGGNLKQVGDWVKSDVSRFCHLNTDEVYELDNIGDVYFNRVVCNGGKAIVVLHPNTNLVYLEKTDGSEVVHIEGIALRVLGHRWDTTGLTEPAIYNQTHGLTTIKSSYISNIDVYALTDIGDLNSWSDDTSKSRASPFIWVTVSDNATMKNCRHFGVSNFYTVRGVAGATHTEENVIGFNCETNIYVKGSEFSSGYSNNIGIINTKTQQSYHFNQIARPQINGKDALLVEANHSDKYIINNVWAKNAIERSAYLQSDNMYITNVSDNGCYSPINIKGSSGITTYISNIIAENTESQGGSMPFYGIKKLSIDNVITENDEKNVARVFVVSDVRSVSIRNARIRNQGIAIYITDAYVIDEINVNDMQIIDSYSASDGGVISRRADSTGTITQLSMKNVSCTLTSPDTALLPLTAYQLNNVTKASLDNCEGYCRYYPFDSEQCDYLSVVNSRFYTVSDTTLYNSFTRLNSDKLRANEFDFIIDFVVTTDPVKVPCTIRFKGYSQESKLSVYDNWSELSANVDVSTTNNTARRLPRIGEHSFEVIASFKSSQIRYIYDAETKTITSIYNVGGMLVTESTEGKIAVYVNQSDLGLYVLARLPQGETGVVSVKCNRF